MPQMTLRTGTEGSSAGSNSSSNKAMETSKQGEVPKFVVAMTLAGVALVLLIVAWTQGWFGQSYAPNTAAKSAAGGVPFTDDAHASPALNTMGAEHPVGNKRNGELQVNNMSSGQRQPK